MPSSPLRRRQPGWRWRAPAGLPAASGRVVLFSLATRNSFVVLPFALALPSPAREAAAAAIVLQSFVELVAMLVLLGLAPRLLPAARP